MGLDLLPRPTTPNSKEFPDGMVHEESELCPFKDDNNPQGIMAGCCSFRGSETAFYLLALGFAPLLLRLYENKLPEEALEFTNELRRTMQRLCNAIEEKAAADLKGSAADSPVQSLDDAEIVVPGIAWTFRMGEARQAIERAAIWHEKVAKMHCGIYAWF